MLSYEPVIHTLSHQGRELSVLRLDLLHPAVSGNKWFKLRYNLLRARESGKTRILTFGGAFSNHIAATAYACREEGFACTGIIRGEEGSAENPTLREARANGMELLFVSRDSYRRKTDPAYLSELSARFPDAWIVPEGGDNEAGEQGCTEILTAATDPFHQIFCAYGSGTTFRGMARSLKPWQQLNGINVLKYEAITDLPQARLFNDYHFGGYARHNTRLLNFKSWFEREFAMPLDYVYTAKMAYAVFDLMRRGICDPAGKILIVHSGGLQGNAGYEARYSLKPSLQVNDPHG